jgi:uncharacterized protein (DUF433 family)
LVYYAAAVTDDRVPVRQLPPLASPAKVKFIATWYNDDMDPSVVNVDVDIQGGTPCFSGTRVPIASLFDHLEGGHTVDYFLSQFPSVRREQVTALLELVKARADQESRVVAER